jgi:hypothetical protein
MASYWPNAERVQAICTEKYSRISIFSIFVTLLRIILSSVKILYPDKDIVRLECTLKWECLTIIQHGGGLLALYDLFCLALLAFLNKLLHCKKSVLKIQEYIHEDANLKFYIPEFFNFKLLIPEYSPIYRFWLQTAAYFFLQCIDIQY